MDNNFCAFILSHGRPENIKTYHTLIGCGYTGKVYIIIDNEDTKASEYYKTFGDKVIMFDKAAIAKTFDEGDNFNNRKTIVYARNACFKIAKDLGIKSFVQLDDDYYYFGYRFKEGAKKIKNLNSVFPLLVNFLKKTNALTIAFSQGGDHIGGFDETKQGKRKAMNSFVCLTERPFKFIGRVNEDVNTYVRLGSIGGLFFTFLNLQLDQYDTQSNKKGMTEEYKQAGTYVKSFYSVIYAPSSVKIKTMGARHKRLHHSIAWENTTPKIIRESYKKPCDIT